MTRRVFQYVCVLLLSASVQAAGEPTQTYAGAWAPIGSKDAILFLFPDGLAVLPIPCIGAQGRWWPDKKGGGITMDLKDADSVATHYILRVTAPNTLIVTKPKDLGWKFHRTSLKLPRR